MPGGISLSVRVTPKASRESIEGPKTAEDGHAWLAVRLSAPPVEGAANAALVRLIAKALGVAKRDVALVSGAGARLKRLHIKGEPAALAKALHSIIEAGS